MPQKQTEKKIPPIMYDPMPRPPWYDPMPRPPWYDPMPPWFHYREFMPERFKEFIDTGDPAPESLLDKDKLAQIKVAQLDMIIAQQEKNLEIIKLQRNLLKEQYKL